MYLDNIRKINNLYAICIDDRDNIIEYKVDKNNFIT